MLVKLLPTHMQTGKDFNLTPHLPDLVYNLHILLPLNVLSVPASVPVRQAIDGGLFSHHDLVDMLHLELGSIVSLDIKDHGALLDDVLTVGDLVGQGEASVGGVLPASFVGPGLVHVVGKVGEEEGSLGSGVVDLVEEDVPGVLHLGPLSAPGDHSVHPVEGAL